MNCPNCNGKIIDGCCINCGYLINGNKIDKSNETEDKYFLQKMFNDDFDTIYRNKNIFLVFILGPLYFSYRGYFIIGTMLTFIDFLIYCFNVTIVNRFVLNSIFSTPLIIFCVVFSRTIYCLFANTICLLIDKIKIKVIKKIYKDKYIEKINDYKHRKIYLILTVLFYLVPIILFVIIKRYQNGLL